MAIFVITFLSLFLSGRQGISAVIDKTDRNSFLSASISDSITKDSPVTFGREMFFMSVGGNAFSGNTSGFSGSVRLTQTGRRVNPSTRTNFKLIKAGKVIDGRGCFLRGFSLFQPLPDLYSFNRHLHLFGILRL